jgi:hypothetical protein
MVYRAFAFDVDGTLLDSQARLRPRVLAALEALRQTGALLLVATAVPQRFARAKLAEAPFLCERGVFLGGAHVVDDAGGFCRQVQMDAAAAQGLIEGLAAADPALQILVQTGPDHHALRLPMPGDVLASWGYPPEALIPFEETLGAPCAKIVAWHESLDLHPLCKELQGRLEGRARLFPSENGHWLQATAWEADKGRGLLALLEHLGIFPAETVALGDELPDVDMFRVVGVSVAMGNAPAAVQAEATWVTASCDEDGVALAIERLMGQ